MRRWPEVSKKPDTMSAQAERQAILAALRICLGNKAQAARLLGISRAALYEKIAVLGVDTELA